MTDENVNSSQSGDDVKVIAGEGMNIQEPSNDESTGEVEGTTVKNEEKASDKNLDDVAASQDSEAEGEAKHSSKTISELGEDRKKLAEQLIELARESDVAATKVKELVEQDPRIEKLLKTKFGKDYDSLMADPDETEQVDLEQLKKQARAEARIEAILEEETNLKTKQAETYAQSHALNSDEFEAFKETVSLLEDKYGYEEALEKALLLVNRDKALAGVKAAQMPAGGTVTPESEPKVQITPELNRYAGRVGRKAEEIAKGLKKVEERLDSDGVMRLSLD